MEKEVFKKTEIVKKTDKSFNKKLVGFQKESRASKKTDKSVDCSNCEPQGCL